MTELAARAGVPAATVVRAKKIEFGDIQINAAMQLAKAEKKPPREIAAAHRRRPSPITPPSPRRRWPGPASSTSSCSDAWLADHATDALALRDVAGRPAGGHRLFVAERGQADAHRPHPLDHHRRRHQAGAARGRLRGGRRQPPGRLGHAVRQAHRRLAQVARRRRRSPPIPSPSCSASTSSSRRSRRPRRTTSSTRPPRSSRRRAPSWSSCSRATRRTWRCGRSSSTCR